MRIYWLRRLRKLSYKTGFQIPPNTCGKGLTIWHRGRLSENSRRGVKLSSEHSSLKKCAPSELTHCVKSNVLRSTIKPQSSSRTAWGGVIIINPATRIGENRTLYSGVLIGHKSAKEGKAAIIGNNVFIGTGTKIIGDVHIGDNVTIGQNCVITKDIPSNSIVVQDNRQLRWL